MITTAMPRPAMSILYRSCLLLPRAGRSSMAGILKVVLPGVRSTPDLDGGGFYPNKDVTITESGLGPLIPVGRRISEDWFPSGPGHETLLPEH